MLQCNYLKATFKQKGYTLHQVADANDISKGYLGPLLNDKIKNLNAQKLQSPPRFLGLEYPLQEKIGVVLGKFYLLHLGHICLI